MPSTKTGIQLGTVDVNFSSCWHTDYDLVTCGSPSTSELYSDCEGGESSQEDKEGHNSEPEPVPGFTNAHVFYKSVKSFSYVHRIGKRNKQNALNFKLTVSSEMQGLN